MVQPSRGLARKRLIVGFGLLFCFSGGVTRHHGSSGSTEVISTAHLRIIYGKKQHLHENQAEIYREIRNSGVTKFK